MDANKVIDIHLILGVNGLYFFEGRSNYFKYFTNVFNLQALVFKNVIHWTYRQFYPSFRCWFSTECIQMAITCLTGKAALLLRYLIELSFKNRQHTHSCRRWHVTYSNYVEIPTLFPEESSLSIICNDQNFFFFFW